MGVCVEYLLLFRMDSVLHLLCFFVVSVPQWAAAHEVEVGIRPVLRAIDGNTQLLVGESITLVCTIPGDLQRDWRYWWYREGKLVSQHGSIYGYTLTPTLPEESGLYTCQGHRKNKSTLVSQPLKIDVVAGWSVLLVPLLPLLVGEEATLTCHILGSPVLREVIFYKDGQELQRKRGKEGATLLLSDVTKENEGSYMCRASWWNKRKWNTVQSLPMKVPVIDVLNEPRMVIVSGSTVVQGNPLVLACNTTLHTYRPDLRIEYYFYQNRRRLGVASQQGRHIIYRADQRDSGTYQCRIAVAGIAYNRWSQEVAVEVIDDESEDDLIVEEYEVDI